MYGSMAICLEKLKITTIMWVFEGVWVICAKPPFLHSLDGPLKMFQINTFAVLKQQTLEKTDPVHCFQTQSVVSFSIKNWLDT